MLLRKQKAQPTNQTLHSNLPAVERQPHHVFISYSRRDARTVDTIVGRIEDMGYKVWIDRRADTSGRYAGAIVEAIRSAKIVMLMASRNAFNSDAVMREVYVAGDYRRPIVMVQLDDADMPDDVIYFTTGYPRLPASQIETSTLTKTLASFV